MSRTKRQFPINANPKRIKFATPAVSTAEVVQKMQAFQRTLPDSDGLKWFNSLYLSVTLAARAQLAKVKVFEDARWIERLDVCFANFYFSAISAAQQRGVDSVPAAWQPLFQNRTTVGIARVQFALAGMNAHINRDLVAALLVIFDADGKAPGINGARFRDFNRVNRILQKVETEVRPALLAGTPLAKGGHFAPLEDVLAMWSVTAARQAAWDHSQALWRLRTVKPVQQASFDALDGLTELASNGLLIRVLP